MLNSSIADSQTFVAAYKAYAAHKLPDTVPSPTIRWEASRQLHMWAQAVGGDNQRGRKVRAAMANDRSFNAPSGFATMWMPQPPPA